MNESPFDTIARRAGLLGSRRGALHALGGAALLAAMPAAGEAKRNRKNKQQALKRCKKQGNVCRTILGDACNVVSGNPEECKTDIAPGCAALARCDAVTALDIFLSVFVI